MKKEKIFYCPKWHEYLLLLPKPILFSISCIFLWIYIHKSIEIAPGESYTLEILNGFLLAVYLLHTASIYHKVDKEKGALEKAWRDKNKEVFCEVLNERISDFSKKTQLIIVLGIIILFFVSPMSIYGGKIIIGISTFFMAFLKEITEEVDDPFTGIYRLDERKIKNRWEDIYKEYFLNEINVPIENTKLV